MTSEDVRNIHFLDDSNWLDFVESDTVSVSFFMSSVHLECRRQIPKIIDFAKRYGNSYGVAVLDVSKSKQALRCCGVRDVPTAVVARRGVFMGGRRGGLDGGSEEELAEMLDAIQHIDMEKYLLDKSERVSAPMK